MATELGVGYVSLTVSTKGLGRDLQKAFNGVDRIGANAGKSLSNAIEGSFTAPDLSGVTKSAEGAAEGSKRAFSGVGAAIKKSLGFSGAFSGIEGDASKAADGVVQEFKSAGDRAGDGMSEGILGKLKGLGGAVAGLGIGLSIMEGITSGMESEKLNDKLSASLGLTGPASAAAGKAAGNLYANAYGESMSDVNDAVGAVVSSLDGMRDASAEDIEAITAKALDMSTAFGVDVNESVGAVGVMMRNGLAADADQAMDLMVGSLQKVPAGFRDELFPAITEYGKHFAGLGIDGATAMGLLVRGAENGTIGVDKMGDAVKEFQIRATDMSKATGKAYDDIGLDMGEMTNELLMGGESAEDAFARIIHAMQGMDDPAAQSAAALALFGTPLEDLSVDQIPEFLGMVDPAGDAFDSMAGKAGELGKTLNDNASTNLTAFTRGLQMTFVDVMGGQVIPALEKTWSALQPVFSFLKETIGYWGPFAAGIAGVAAAYGLWTAATTIQTTAIWASTAALLANPVTWWVAGIGLMIGALVLMYNKVGWFKDFVNAAWVVIKAAIGAVVNWFRDTAMPTLKATIENIGAFFTWLNNRVIQPVWQWIKGAVSAVVDWFRNSAVPFFQAAIDSLARKFNWFYRNILGPIMFLVRWAIDKVVTWFKANAVPVFQRAIQSLADKFGWFKNNIINPIWTWVQGKINAVTTWFVRVLVPIFQRAIQALANKFGAFRAAVNVVWNRVKSILSAGWGWIDRHVFSRFRAGLDRLRDAFNRTKDGIGRAWDKLRAKVREPISFVVNKVINPFLNGYNRINDAWSGDNINTIPGFRKGGYTGNYGKDEVAGLVHGREQVIRAESTAAINRTNPGLLEAMNKYGAAALPFAGGGCSGSCSHALHDGKHMANGPLAGSLPFIQGELQSAITRARGLNLAGYAGYPASLLRTAAQAWNGRAGVTVGVNGNAHGVPTVAVQRGPMPRPNVLGYYSGRVIQMSHGNRMETATLVHEVGHALGLHHADGAPGGSIMHSMLGGGTFWPTAYDTTNLRRLYGMPGSGSRMTSAPDGGDDGSGLLDDLRDLVTGPLGKLRSMFEGNDFVDIAKGIADKVIQGLLGKAKDSFFGATAPVAGVWDDPVGTTHQLRPGLSTIYNGTGSTEFFQRVDPSSPGGPVELSATDRALLAEIRDRVGIEIDGRSLVKANRTAEARFARR